MPKQNRVNPYGEIIAVPEKGLFMGNRGILHNERQEIITPYRHKAWIICQLEFKDRKRKLMSPGQYTELFFLDEVTALAAGHRPCFECRRQAAVAFQKAWLANNPNLSQTNLVRVPDMDAVLHEERITHAWRKEKRKKRTYTAVLATLPSGTFVDVEKQPYLVWNGRLLPWSAGGYLNPIFIPSEKEVSVLTPPSTVQALAQGYLPVVHHSVEGAPP